MIIKADKEAIQYIQGLADIAVRTQGLSVVQAVLNFLSHIEELPVVKENEQ